ncbi:unnamed protein product [Gadus morhua 'NCC']
MICAGAFHCNEKTFRNDGRGVQKHQARLHYRSPKVILSLGNTRVKHRVSKGWFAGQNHGLSLKSPTKYFFGWMTTFSHCEKTKIEDLVKVMEATPELEW